MRISFITYLISIALVLVKAQYPYEIHEREYVDELMTRDLEQYARRELLSQLSARELATEFLARLERRDPAPHEQVIKTCSRCGMVTTADEKHLCAKAKA